MTVGDPVLHRATGRSARIVDRFSQDGRAWFLVRWAYDPRATSTVEVEKIDLWFVLDQERAAS